MPDAALVTLVLELERGADPIAGRLTADDGAAWSFTGWLQLTEALEEAKAADSAPTARRSADGRGGRPARSPQRNR